ncbi:MAG: efflux RND transporter periplasmic adaptor subunit [Muribaculaceae bacterium]|nr:efflux RND transporter periplasmic adaptor subunit [Muribaculaceae bacterium]
MLKNILSKGAIAVSVTLSVASCSKDNGEQNATAQQAQIPEVAVQTLEIGSADLQSSYPATLKGKTDIDIRPQVSGFITKVHVDEGQKVKKGQVLFTIDQVQFEAAVSQAQAAVNSAQAAVNTAITNEKNQKMLLDKGIISQSQWQASADQLAQARAGLAQAQAALTTARKNLSYTVVTAPSDGVVGSIPSREGSLASPSSVQPLTTISDISQMYAYFSLNENDLIALTQNGTVDLDAALAALPPVSLMLSNGVVYPNPGKIATVTGVIDSSTGAATVRALFDNPTGMLRSGASGTIVLPTHQEDIIIVPQSATFENQDMTFVYLVNDSSIAVPTPIQKMDLNDGKNFVVTAGVKAGDKIVVEGVNTVVRGKMPVKPVAPQAPATAE